MKVLNICFILLFTASAILQYNDPDPHLWVPIYLYGAVMCWLALRRRFYPVALWAGILFYSFYALFLLFQKDGVLDWWEEHNAENIAQSMKATKPWIEATREFFGLLILISALVLNLKIGRKISRSRR